MKYNFVDLGSFMGGAYIAAAPAFVGRRLTEEEAGDLFPGGALPEEIRIFWDLEPISADSNYVVLIDEGLRGSPLLSFILAHEKGHIERGHFDMSPSQEEIIVLESGTRFVNSASREIEADASAFRELGVDDPERRVALLMAVIRQVFISRGVPPEKVAAKSDEEIEKKLMEVGSVLGARLAAARVMVW